MMIPAPIPNFALLFTECPQVQRSEHLYAKFYHTANQVSAKGVSVFTVLTNSLREALRLARYDELGVEPEAGKR